MDYLVVVSLELNCLDAGSYDCMYARLKDIGLERSLTDQSGRERTLPAATVAGKFKGSSARNIRNDICTKVGVVFDHCEMGGKALIAVGGDWDWGIRKVRGETPYSSYAQPNVSP